MVMMCGWDSVDMISISLRMWTKSCSSLIFSFLIDFMATWKSKSHKSDCWGGGKRKQTNKEWLEFKNQEEGTGQSAVTLGYQGIQRAVRQSSWQSNGEQSPRK